MPGRAGLLVKKPFKDSPHTLRSSPVSAWSPGTCGSLGAEQGRPGVTLAALSSWASCRRPRGNVSFPIHIRPFLLTLCHTELCCRFVLKAQKATDVKASNFLHRKQKQNVGKGPPPSPAAVSPGLDSETTASFPTRCRESSPNVTSVFIHLVTDGAA